MTAMDAREDLDNERIQRTMDAEETAAKPAYDEYSTTNDSTSLDMAGFASELNGIASRQDAEDAEPDSFELPSYAAAAAQYEEDNGTTMSDEEETSAEADRRNAEVDTRLAAGRNRYVLEAAEEEEEAWFCNTFIVFFSSYWHLKAGAVGGTWQARELRRTDQTPVLDSF